MQEEHFTAEELLDGIYGSVTEIECKLEDLDEVNDNLRYIARELFQLRDLLERIHMDM